jgi:hypothetical protein
MLGCRLVSRNLAGGCLSTLACRPWHSSKQTSIACSRLGSAGGPPFQNRKCGVPASMSASAIMHSLTSRRNSERGDRAICVRQLRFRNPVTAGSLGSLRFPTQPVTPLGGRGLLFVPHSEQGLINQVITILLGQRREAKQESVIHGSDNRIDQ